MTRRRALWVLAIVALALAASGNSILNGFAYDDVFLIQDAPDRMGSLDGWWREFGSTYWPASGLGPGDGYRPLTVLSFRAQYALGGGSPMVFHALNILLHVLGTLAVLWLASALLPPAAAWVAAALYAVHPVHTEAVANVVGQSELWVVLLLVASTTLYIRGRQGGPVGWGRWLGIGAMFAAALLYKEHGIVLLALLPLAELTVVRDSAPLRVRARRLALPMVGLLAVVAGYLAARAQVIPQGTGFQPATPFRMLDLTATDRILTMIGAVPEWVRLFLWPARLSAEYSPPYISLATEPALWQVPGLFMLAGVIALFVLAWRRTPVLAFGLGWLMITLLPVSNFVVPAGFLIAERTLMSPSVGVMIALASAVPWLYGQVESRPDLQQIAVGSLVVLLGLGIWRSADRNRDWNDSVTVMRESIRSIPDSYRTHYMLGVLLFQRLELREGEEHFRTAMQLFPHDPYMLWSLAERYRGSNLCEPALPLYRSVQELIPEVGLGLPGHADCALRERRLDEARAVLATWDSLGGPGELMRPFRARADALDDSLRVEGQDRPVAGAALAPRDSSALPPS